MPSCSSLYSSPHAPHGGRTRRQCPRLPLFRRRPRGSLRYPNAAGSANGAAGARYPFALPGETTSAPQVTVTPAAPPVRSRAPFRLRRSPAAFSLGVPAGDVYSLSGLAVDAQRGLAYVYAGRAGLRPAMPLPATLTVPAISVVDLASRAVVRLIELPPAGLCRQRPVPRITRRPARLCGGS